MAALFVAVVYRSQSAVGGPFRRVSTMSVVRTQSSARSSMRAVRFLPVFAGRREYQIINANVHTRWHRVHPSSYCARIRQATRPPAIW